MTKPGWAGVAAAAALFSFISISARAEDDLDAGVVADVDAGMGAVSDGLSGITEGGSCALPVGAGGPVPSGARRVTNSAEMTRIRGEDNYFERGMTRIEYYGAELAIFHYEDGTSIRVPLTDRLTEAPFQSVDCDTPRDGLLPVETAEGLSLTTRAAAEAQAALHPETPPLRIIGRIAAPVSVASHSSGRTVPVHVNNITAPWVCEQLTALRDEYVRQWDAMASATVEALESMAFVLEIALARASFSGGGPTPAGSIGSYTVRTVGRVVSRGLSATAAEGAFVGMRSGGGHAIRHLITEGIIPNSGSLATRVGLFRSLILPILRSPVGRAFSWRIGDTAARGFLGRVGGRWVATFVAEDGPFAGRVISSVVPDSSQLALMLGRAGFAGI